MDTKSSQALSPLSSSSGRSTRSIRCSSPEFEFCMVRNPSFPQPNILSADELFVDGFILPLHLISTQNKPDPEPPTPPPHPEPESSPAITATTTASKRWKDIFRKSTDKKNAENNNNNNNAEENEKEKAKKKEKKVGSGGGASASAELNINIWPFSRSRSAGNSGTRPKSYTTGAPVFRKGNSAPCSRSNSAGESKSRKWPNSPGRAGIHLGRSSPVWQVRRGSSAAKNTEPPSLNPEKSKRETPTSRRRKLASSGASNGSAKAKVLNLNVPMCIGYGHHLSCRSDNNSAIGVSGGSESVIHGSNSNDSVHAIARNANVIGGKLFNLRSFFTKKSFVTSH